MPEQGVQHLSRGVRLYTDLRFFSRDWRGNPMRLLPTGGSFRAGGVLHLMTGEHLSLILNGLEVWAVQVADNDFELYVLVDELASAGQAPC